MSRKVEVSTILKLVEKLNEMKELGAAPKDIENLEDDIGNLQMNVIVGDLLDED